MRWEKLGRIFEPYPKGEFLLTHASNPTAILLNEGVFRVFYNGRDSFNRSSVSFFDYDLEKHRIVYHHPIPIAVFGTESTYYSHGISLGSVFKERDVISLFFMGWQCPDGEHWKGEIGKMTLSNSLDLIAIHEPPFLSFDDKHDQISLSYPFILKQDNLYRMWYGSTHDWSSSNGEMIHAIHYAESTDGENWKRFGPAFNYQIGVAQAFSRPIIYCNKSGFHMWFSYRSGTGQSYRIGYAHSSDGYDWAPDYSLKQIDVSAKGWDSEMICYPFTVEFKDQLYLFYNGNGFGKTGIGLAMLKE